MENENSSVIDSFAEIVEKSIDSEIIQNYSKIKETFKQDLNRRREIARVSVTWILLCLLGTLICFGLYNAGGEKSEDTIQLIDTFLPVLAGLLGSAVTFYFVQKER